VIVVSPAGLRRILSEYVAYYHQSRTHLALDKDSAMAAAGCAISTRLGRRHPEVGGLHHRYDRRAA